MKSSLIVFFTPTLVAAVTKMVHAGVGRDKVGGDDRKACAYFPYAVAQAEDDFSDNGKRSLVKRGSENVPLPMKQWETMQVAAHGTRVGLWSMVTR